MRIYHSMAIASVVSASAIAFALTPTEPRGLDREHTDYEYASTIRQNCTICNETGAVTVMSDSVNSYNPCPACGGTGELTSATPY